MGDYNRILFGAAFACVILLSILNEHDTMKRIITHFRTCLRRWLGMEHWEQLQLEELRTYRADVDRWTREIPSRGNIARLCLRVESTRREMQEHGIQLQQIKAKLEPSPSLEGPWTRGLADPHHGPAWPGRDEDQLHPSRDRETPPG